MTVYAFAISGGIFLFATALPMLFGVRLALQSPDRDERRTAGEDIAIFPLAIPLLSGLGAEPDQAGADPRRLGILALATAVVYLVAFWVLNIGEWLMRHLGEGRVLIQKATIDSNAKSH